MPPPPSAPNSQPPSRSHAETELDLKKELLRVVLANTVKRNGVPPQWISGEVNAMNLPTGEEWIEVRLTLQVDEARFLTYLTSFQADFERRLIAIAPDVKQWLSRIAWTLMPDPVYEVAMPTPEYWEHVLADRELTARQKGAMDWDKETLARHFSDTNPGDLVVDFDDTNPPDRQIENLAPPKDNTRH